MKIALLAFAAITLLVSSSNDARGQSNIAPSSQLGIGINTGGMTVQYAINPGFHIGLGVALQSTNVSDTLLSESATVWAFGPYARFLFEGPLNPFIDAGLGISDVGFGTAISLFAGFGLEYFANRNVGVFAAVRVVDVQLDPSTVTSVGILSPRAGVEYFFDR